MSLSVAVAAVATYNNSDYDNVPSAAQAAKQADINIRRAVLYGKNYFIKEDSSGAPRKKTFPHPKSGLKKKKTSTSRDKTQTTARGSVS